MNDNYIKVNIKDPKRRSIYIKKLMHSPLASKGTAAQQSTELRPFLRGAIVMRDGARLLFIMVIHLALHCKTKSQAFD